MLGGIDGDPNFNYRGDNPNVLRAGPPDALAGATVSTAITLPNNKTCDYCVLQWVWAARNDNGFYVSCADIAITANGAPRPTGSPSLQRRPRASGALAPTGQPHRQRSPSHRPVQTATLRHPG